MKTYYDCIPCFTQQALDAARLAGNDTDTHETIVRAALKAISEMDMKRTPPEMGALIYRLVSRLSGNPDPYQQIKKQFNRIALDLYSEFETIQETSGNPFEKAARLAISGNIIDFGVGARVDSQLLTKTIESTLKTDILGSVQAFEDAVDNATKILYLGDNAGEVVFDRFFIEHLIKRKGTSETITFAVRGEPIINDITMIDAEETGMTNLVKVIDNGTGYPGTVLSECSNEFCKHFHEADLVISKGQGNYETLSDVDKNIFFLLKVKCKVVARDIGCELGRSVIISR